MSTAEELWSSGTFILKRLLEQHEYRTDILSKYIRKEIDADRYWELYDAQAVITERFRKRFDELFGHVL